jgi:hypothetical protein
MSLRTTPLERSGRCPLDTGLGIKETVKNIYLLPPDQNLQ